MAALALLPTSATERLTPAWQLPLLLGVGVSAAIGQLCLTYAFSTGTAAKVSVVGLSQIVFAMPFDVWLWGQPVHPATLVGVFLVVAPTAWLLTRSPRERRAGPVTAPVEGISPERSSAV
jgi:drug/metabolite transporter (DMT)-like permease